MTKFILSVFLAGFVSMVVSENFAEARLFQNRQERRQLIQSKFGGDRQAFRAARKSARQTCKSQGLRGEQKRACMLQMLQGGGSAAAAGDSAAAVPSR